MFSMQKQWPGTGLRLMTESSCAVLSEGDGEGKMHIPFVIDAWST